MQKLILSKRKIVVVSIICIIVFTIFAVNTRRLLSENVSDVKIAYEKTTTGSRSYVFDISEIENSITIFELLKKEKGVYVNEGISNFFWGQNQTSPNDGVITIYSSNESLAIYSSGVIWSISDNKYIYLDLFNNREEVNLLYSKLHDLIITDKH